MEPQASGTSHKCQWQWVIPRKFSLLFSHKVHPRCLGLLLPLPSSLQSSTWPAVLLQISNSLGQDSLSRPPSLCVMPGHDSHDTRKCCSETLWEPDARKARKEASSPPQAPPYAVTGTAIEAVLPTLTNCIMSVPVVNTRIMVLRSALKLRREQALTKLGNLCSSNIIYLSNILGSFTHCTKVLMLVYSLFILLLHQLIAPPCFCIPRSTKRWSQTNSRRVITLAHACSRKLRPLLASSSLHRSPGSPSQGSQVNTKLSIISPIHILLPQLYPPLILPSMQTCSHVHGAPLPLFATLFSTSLLVPRQPSVMSLKPTALFQSSQVSGQAWLSSCWARTNLPSTSATILALHQLGEFMAKSAMLLWTSPCTGDWSHLKVGG